MGNQFAATKGSGSGTLTFSGSSGSTKLNGAGGTVEELREEIHQDDKEKSSSSDVPREMKAQAKMENQIKIEPEVLSDGNAPPTYQDAVGGRE